MIGYYVHHVGHGHLSHAMSISACLRHPVTVLSSLPRPTVSSRPWVWLPRDDSNPSPVDPTASGQLHWAPIADRGLQDRMARLADWIAQARPSAIVSDVSVEVSALARLMGVPVVSMALPGARGDPAHQLGYSLSDAIIAPWFERFSGLCPSLRPHSDKVHYVGAFSRFDALPHGARSPGSRRRVLVLQGTGSVRTPVSITAAATKDWEWSWLGPGRWHSDPWEEISIADVIVTHAGLGALGEVAAARKPAIVIPEPRPHGEQVATAEMLEAARLALVVRAAPAATEWPDLLSTALELGGSRWQEWSSGAGARAAAEVVSGAARCGSAQG